MAQRSLTLSLLAAAATLAAGTGAAAAQSDPRLVAIVRLAQDGQNDSARAEMQRFMAGVQPSDSLYPEALYTAALVAATDQERRLNLRKVTVEHSRSSWADDAILLLAQLDYASGDPGGTVTQITKLLEDYPLSPLRATGAFWGARAAGDLGQGRLACRWAEIGLSAAGTDVELATQLRYQAERCAAIATMAPDSAPATADSAAAPPTPPPPPPPPARRTGYFVQVAALPAAPPADEIAASLRRMNYEVVIVQEGGYHKVRAGPFPNRRDASAALARIRSSMGGQPFIVSVR
jgi:cell division septation protein DedD